MDMALIKEVFSAIISASEVKLLFSMSVIITVLVFAKFSNF
jgi:hypothetical protein